MTQEEQVLVDKCVAYKKAEEENRKAALKVLEQLSALAPHQKGEIIEWTEHNRKNIGTMLNPIWVESDIVTKRAVVTHVQARVNVWNYNGSVTFGYKYDFKPFKKNGELSQNHCYPYDGMYKWTGEKYNKEI